MRSVLCASALFAYGLASAAACPPSLCVTPSPINVGGTQIGMSVSQMVNVLNNGNTKVSVANIQLTQGSPDYTLSGLQPFPLALFPGVSIPFTVTFKPSVNGITMGNLEITSDDQANPKIDIALSGYAGAADISLDSGSIIFGDINLGAASAPNVVNITNSGFSNLSVSDIQVSGPNAGDFIVDKKMAAPSSIMPTAMQPFSVTFKPTALGTRSATVTVVSAAGSKSVLLSGNGTSAMIAVSPNKLDFGDQRTGDASKPMPITINNMGTGVLHVMSLNLADPDNAFAPAMNQPTSFDIKANGSAMVQLVCNPPMNGAHMATLTVASDVGASAPVTLACTGVAPVIAVSPASLSFGATVVGATAMGQLVTITNNGTDALNIADTAIIGANASDFNIVEMLNYPITIAPNKSTTFNVNFIPSGGGDEAATLQIDSDDPVSPLAKVDLKGTGIMPNFATDPDGTMPIDLGSVSVGSSSMPSAVKIMNTGMGPITVAGVTFGGPDAAAFSVDMHAPLTIAEGGTTTVNVTFTPTKAGAAMATLTIAVQEVPNMTAMIDFTATAVPLTVGVNPLMLDFGSIAVGTTSMAIPVSVTNSGATPIQITGVTSSDPTFVIDMSATKQLLPGPATTTFTVTFTPTDAGMKTGTVMVAVQGVAKPILVALSGNAVTPMMRATPPGGCSAAPLDARPAPAALALVTLALAFALLRRRRSSK